MSKDERSINIETGSPRKKHYLSHAQKVQEERKTVQEGRGEGV